MEAACRQTVEDDLGVVWCNQRQFSYPATVPLSKYLQMLIVELSLHTCVATPDWTILKKSQILMDPID